MARCVQCGQETELVSGGVPICPRCDSPSELAIASDRLNAARKISQDAIANLNQADELARGGTEPQSLDGSLARRQANQVLSRAADECQAALRAYLIASGKSQSRPSE